MNVDVQTLGVDNYKDSHSGQLSRGQSAGSDPSLLGGIGGRSVAAPTCFQAPRVARISVTSRF